MRRLSRAVVSVGGMWLVLLHATAVCGQNSSGTTLRMPARGQLSDGAPLYGTPSASGEEVLLEMAGRAAVIFVGTVKAVQKPADELLQMGAAGAAVEVDFYVERSVRGATTGSVYALREWAGMWRDSQRFVPGQRLLMLLHAKGPGGLSSPVDGLDGAIPLRGGRVSPAALTGSGVLAQAASPAGGTSAEDQVDMRWLQAKMLKIPSYADAPVASPGVSAAGGGETVAVAAGTNGTQSGGGVSGGSGSSQIAAAVDGGSERLSRILGLLGVVQALNEGTQRASN